MRLFNAIFGLFALFAALYCLFWSSTPLFNMGWMLAFLMGFRGLCSVIIYGIAVNNGRRYPALLVTGIIGLGIGVASVVVSCLSIQDKFVFALIVLTLFVACLIVDGIVSISSSQTIRKKYGTRWKLRLVLGIVTLALGVFSVIAACFGLLAAANMLSWALFVYGIVLIMYVFDRDESVEDTDLW